MTSYLYKRRCLNKRYTDTHMNAMTAGFGGNGDGLLYIYLIERLTLLIGFGLGKARLM